MALVLAGTPASAHGAVQPGPRCLTRIAPYQCAIRHEARKTNHWRTLTGSPVYQLHHSPPASRPRLLQRWDRRRVAARRFYRKLWAWAHQPKVWCVHTHESADWHYHGSDGGGFDGGYQYLVSTWLRAQAQAGSRYTPRADLASATVQARVTRHYTRRHGWGEWPNTAAACGLL